MKIGKEIVNQEVLNVVHKPGILRVYLEFSYLQRYESDLIAVKLRGRLQTVTNICNRKHH